MNLSEKGDNIRIKLNIAKIITVMAELSPFKEELQFLFLPLLEMETLSKFKDYELHEALINLIDCLFIPS
jgi:hypothetical protein